MRILFIGDIVGRSGRAVLLERLGVLVRDWKLDFVALNGENAAGGFGITEAIYQEFVDAGADVITGGNHSWDQKEALVFIERAPRLLRPINYPAGTPGRGVALIEAFRAADRSFAWRDPPYEYEHVKLPFDILAGSSALREQLEARVPAQDIARSWEADVAEFQKIRGKFLLY